MVSLAEARAGDSADSGLGVRERLSWRAAMSMHVKAKIGSSNETEGDVGNERKFCVLILQRRLRGAPSNKLKQLVIDMSARKRPSQHESDSEDDSDYVPPDVNDGKEPP